MQSSSHAQLTEALSQALGSGAVFAGEAALEKAHALGLAQARREVSGWREFLGVGAHD